MSLFQGTNLIDYRTFPAGAYGKTQLQNEYFGQRKEIKLKPATLTAVLKHLAVAFLGSILIPMAAMAYTEHPGGTIITETWGPGTHYVTGSITLADDHVLTVMPGAVAKFAPNVQLTVYGTLNAAGTA